MHNRCWLFDRCHLGLNNMKTTNSIPLQQEELLNESVCWEVLPDAVIIPRCVSQLLLKTVLQTDSRYDEKFEGYITSSEFFSLRDIFRSMTKKVLATEKSTPRNLIFYQVISRSYPDFNWKVILSKKKKTGSPVVKVIANNRAMKNGFYISLAMFLLERVKPVKHITPSRRFAFHIDVCEQSKKEVVEFLTLINATRVDERQLQILDAWYIRARKQKKATLFSGICPDYAHTRIAKNLYRFTFDGLNDGVGVSAIRLVNNIEEIHNFFIEKEIAVSHVAGIGDFEAFSKNVLVRVGETEESFLAKLETSQKALSKKINANDRMQFEMISHLCGGKENWLALFHEVLKRLQAKDFGATGIGQRDLEAILKSRKPLLQRWFPKIAESTLEDLVIRQGAEYATLSHVVHQSLRDPLIIGVDHFKMLPFYNYHKKIPIFYLSSNYMENQK